MQSRLHFSKLLLWTSAFIHLKAIVYQLSHFYEIITDKQCNITLVNCLFFHGYFLSRPTIIVHLLGLFHPQLRLNHFFCKLGEGKIFTRIRHGTSIIST